VTSAGLLHEFLPASEILRVAEAVLRVFARLGDYQHKQRNQMKFMIRSLGWTRWREEYDRELAACRLRGAAPTLDIDPPAAEAKPDWVPDSSPSAGYIAGRVSGGRITGPGLTPTVVPILHSSDEAFGRWRVTNVHPQKQFGYVMAVATVPLGDLTSEQMRVVGELARAYGDGAIRVTPDQDLLFRWVNASDVRQLYRRLAAAGLGLAEAGTIADVASCPGAETCRLAVTQSRGLGRLLEDHLRARPDLIEAADGARIKISGCPNGCGQHHVATIGFQGSVRRVGSRALPQYFVMVGGGMHETGASSRAAPRGFQRSGFRTQSAADQIWAAIGVGDRGHLLRAPAALIRAELPTSKRIERPISSTPISSISAGRRVRAGGHGRECAANNCVARITGQCGRVRVRGCWTLDSRRRLGGYCASPIASVDLHSVATLLCPPDN
jgi:sulfite reductase beta subunit-like hemoprotein